MRENLSPETSPPPSIFSFRGNWPLFVKDFLREHLYFISGITIFLLIVNLIANHYNVIHEIKIGFYSRNFALLIFIFAFSSFVIYSIYVMFLIRPQRLFRYIYVDLKENHLIPQRILKAVPVLVLFQIFASCFTSLKSLIPLINPYSWDLYFIRLDGWIHFGFQPWELLHPFLGYPLITYLINFLYNLWIFVVPFFIYYQIFSLKNRRLRMQFLLSTVAAWSILGSFLATFFSSVGPCFYGELTGDHEIFEPLMKYLTTVNKEYHIFALDAQQHLWDNYAAKKLAIGSGISAMPSMHVSQSLLMAIMAWHKNKALGVLFSFYTFVIMLGSVHLAWHYAVDGYLSIIMTPIIWIFSGWLLRHIGYYTGAGVS